MLTIQDVLAFTQGKLLSGNPSRKIFSVSTDTRTLRKGSLFVALKGKNFNGHAFLDTAIQKKATALLISEENSIPKISAPVIYVKDTLRAYSDLAHGYRERFNLPVVAITGSAGKTTTKELGAKVLSARGPILKNYQTENNEIGVSKTLLKLHTRHKIAVLEFGTNHFGEIERLAFVGRPTVAVLTNIGESHLEFLRNRQGVLKEKSTILKPLNRRGFVIYNNDDDLLRTLHHRKIAGKKITFAIHRRASYQATGITFGKASLCFRVGPHPFCLKTLSKENIYNALAAIALGRLFGLSWVSIRQSLSRARFPKGRQDISRVSGLTIIDDTYNANPTSVAAALDTLRRFSAKRRRWFIFGDMRELGAISRAAHEKIGKSLLKYGVDNFLTYGSWSRCASQKARTKGIFSVHCKTHDDIIKEMRKKVQPGDIVLVKGSRGMHMEKVIEKIKATHF